MSYEYTTIEYTHPNPQYRSRESVSIFLQVADEEIVAGAQIDISSDHR